MAGPKIPNSAKPKKRWRIGGMRSSKSKSSKDDGDDHSHTDPPTPESSNGSLEVGSTGSQEDNNPLGDFPPAMSEVDSDSDDEDLYLENNDEEFNSSYSKQRRNLRDDHYQSNSDSSFEEDMMRHRMDRKSSPVFSKELHKITEDTDEDDHLVDNNPFDDDYDKNPFDDDDEKDESDFGKAYNNDDTFDKNDDENDKKKAASQKPSEPLTPSKPATDRPSDDEEVPIELPTHKELSKTLCKIVATEHYSERESLLALEKLSKWAHTQESNLLKHLLTYGGVVKVIDFMDEIIDMAGAKPAHPGDYLLEAIHKAVDVICNVCFVGKHGINEDIAIVNATVVVKYGGIETLLRASDAYNRSNAKDDPVALKAVEGVWNAIMNVYCNAEAAVTKEISILVVDAAIETMSSIGSVDHAIATETLANVFNSLYRITYHGFVTQKEFQEKNILTHCLNVFKRDVATSSDGDEELLEEAMSFLYGCHEKSLLRKGSDYESVLPLCVMGLREFAFDNENIREWASKLLDGACSNIDNKSSIMMAEGAIEAIAPFLTFQDVSAGDKEFMRNLIRKIVAPV